MTERLPPICSAAQIKAAYHQGLTIVWDENGRRMVWEVTAVDDTSATTRFLDDEGRTTEHQMSFEDLSNHSAFPVGTTISHESFSTPAGSFEGSHAIVDGDDGEQHFFFSDAHAGPPIIIRRPGFVSQQVERSDIG